MLGIFKVSIIGLVLASCSHYQKLESHNKVIAAFTLGSLTSLAFLSSSPAIGAYMIGAGGLTGTLVGVYELSEESEKPLLEPSLIMNKKLVDSGTGYLSQIDSSDSKTKLKWKMYSINRWHKNQQGQFFLVDKLIEFEPAQENK